MSRASFVAKLSIGLPLLGLLAPAVHPQQAPTFALLLTSTNDKIAQPVLDYLQNEGITVVARPLAEPLSQELLRQFHLVMLIDFAGLQMPLFHDPSPGGYISQYFTIKQNIAELQQYVEAGGGLFFSPVLEGGGLAVSEALQPLLSPWGVQVLAANARDDAHTWRNYAWTTNIADSPVTEGVKCLYYPIEMGRWDDAYPTTPFALRDPRWQPVVRGMPGSVVAQCLQYTTWHPTPEAPNPPVLAATAQLGRGRAALLAINRYFTFVYPYEEVANGSIGEFHTGPIGGVVMEKGDGQTPSDGRLLIRNMLRWVAESAAAAGMGTYTPEAYAAAPTPPKATVPNWLTGWWEGNGATFHKVLIGARSAYSSGTGTLAEWAEAARQAGYAILVMTEDLADFAPENWRAFYADCQRASSADLVVLPGLDMQDAYGNRLLLYGQAAFPQPWMLTPDGKAMKEIQYLMLGFGTCLSAIHRATTSPLPQELFKFFSGIVVYTYDRNGDLADDSTLAYQAQIHNMSNPIPLVVHELYAPDQVAKAAQSGHQLYIPADTVENAAWYMRDGMSHFWEVPVRFLVTSGPMIRLLNSTAIHVEDQVPIADVRYYAQHNLLRRWKPNSTEFQGEVAPPPANLNMGFMWVADANGRTAISPPLRVGATHGYTWRCSDRQNFFSVAVNYTGTILSDGVDIWLPAFGTDEGRGLWPHQFGARRGENMATRLLFPFFSPVMSLTEAEIDQRYWRAQWEDVVFDAKAPQGTARSRVYEGRVRYYDMHHKPYGQRGNDIIPLMLMQVELRLRQPVVPTGDIFPGFVNVGSNPTCLVQDEAGAWVSRALTQGYLDLPVGGQANDLVALSSGLRVNAQGMVGFIPPAGDSAALPVGYSWRANWVRLDPALDVAEQRKILGLEGATPYKLKLTRGKLESPLYVTALSAEGYGVAGEIEPYDRMPFALPVRVKGVNWGWPAGAWRAGLEAEQDLTQCGVFEGEAWARLDVTRGGPFYVGNLVTAGDRHLRIGLLDWTAEAIRLELNNPTDVPIETTVQTPPEIRGRYRLAEQVSLQAGEATRVEFR